MKSVKSVSGVKSQAMTASLSDPNQTDTVSISVRALEIKIRICLTASKAAKQFQVVRTSQAVRTVFRKDRISHNVKLSGLSTKIRLNAVQ